MAIDEANAHERVMRRKKKIAIRLRTTNLNVRRNNAQKSSAVKYLGRYACNLVADVSYVLDDNLLFFAAKVLGHHTLA